VRAIGQHVGDHDVVHVGAVVHGINDDIPLGDALQRRLVLIVDGHAVQEIEDDPGEVVADLVVGQDVQLWHDLVDVLLDRRRTSACVSECSCAWRKTAVSTSGSAARAALATRACWRW